MKRRKSPLKGYQKVRGSHLSFIRILLCRNFTQGVSEGKGRLFIIHTCSWKGGHLLGPLFKGCRRVRYRVIISHMYTFIVFTSHRLS